MLNTVISIENVSKSYQLGTIGTGTFYGDLKRWWARQRGKPDPYQKIGEADHGNRQGETIWALRDIKFQVQQGEIFGIIGRNGAGKSTLLKILSRVTVPTSGEIKVRGRIASLLEVGTGFHPELTGRENIYLNGAIMGMSKAEISLKFDEIVDFSEVEQFIDTPVKRYSSGMYVRLAFAVAANLESEILIVDEVLAVGDVEFQKKCLGKMEDVSKGQGRTVLFVSHNMGAVRSLCGFGIWLDSGQILKTGLAHEVIKEYEERNVGFLTQSSHAIKRNTDDIKGSGLHFDSVEIRNTEGKYATDFKYGERLILNVNLDGQLAGGMFSAEFHIYNELGILVAVGASGPYHGEYFSSKVRALMVEIGPLTITKGRYRLLLSLMAGFERIDTWDNAVAFSIAECQPFQMSWDIRAHTEGVCVLQHSFREIDQTSSDHVLT